MTTLFQRGQFTLHGGEFSEFKIDCDALTDDDIETLAVLIAYNRSFSVVEGVPRGGIRLSRALSAYCQDTGPLLIVDDVLTTGGSMEAQRAGRSAEGLVLFARGRCPYWVTALFTMQKGMKIP